MSEKIVTIRQYDNSIQAHIDKIYLEEEGIQCFIQDEHLITINWLYANAIGGIKLQIFESDLENAESIFKKRCDIPKNENEDKDHLCPECNSNDIAPEKFSKFFSVLALIISSCPIPFYKKKWKCYSCGHKWKR